MKSKNVLNNPEAMAGYTKPVDLKIIMSRKHLKNVPYMISKDGKRIPNPILNKSLVSAKKSIKRSKANATYIYPIAVSIPTLTYETPIIISTPGLTIIKNRNIRSTDSGVPAIQVWNGASVEIFGCNIVSCGDMINASGGASLNIHNNILYGDTPTNGAQYGRALNCYHPKSLTFYNNTVEHSGGILIDHSESNVPVPVTIYNNIIRNTDKRDAAGNAKDHRASILFNTVPLLEGYIAYNQFVNEMNNSHVEDNVNLYNSGGSQLKPFSIYTNFIFGAYPYPLTADAYTGSGITIDGDPGTNQLSNMSQWVNIYDNQIISTCNACMNIAAGHDIHSYNNTYISSGMFPDGTISQRFWGACCIWDASNVGTNFKNNDQKNNTIGYVRPDVNVPFPGRQDWVVVPNNPLSIKAGDNISLPNPITLTTEADEFIKWNKKLKDANITIGVNGTNTPPIIMVGLSLKIGQKAVGKVTPLNVKGDVVSFKAGTLKAVSSDATIATISVSADEKTISVTTLKAGIASGNIMITTNGGKTLSKTFTMEVLDITPTIDDEAVDIKIEFVIS